MHHCHLSLTGISCLKFLLQGGLTVKCCLKFLLKGMIKATGQLSFFMVHVCDQTVAG